MLNGCKCFISVTEHFFKNGGGFGGKTAALIKRSYEDGKKCTVTL